MTAVQRVLVAALVIVLFWLAATRQSVTAQSTTLPEVVKVGGCIQAFAATNLHADANTGAHAITITTIEGHWVYSIIKDRWYNLDAFAAIQPCPR